eukprot:scaffold18562_cov63-Phaeocystis_antarctica.AAC.4
MSWRASRRSPLPTQTSSSGATGAVERSAAGMSVSARARATSAAHSRPNLTTGKRRRYRLWSLLWISSFLVGSRAGSSATSGRRKSSCSRSNTESNTSTNTKELNG